MPQLMFGLAKFHVVDATRKPIAGALVLLKSIDSQRREVEFEARTDAEGELTFIVPQQHLPQLPTDAEFEIVTPKGVRERGKVRCGGNEAILTREVVLQSA